MKKIGYWLVVIILCAAPAGAAHAISTPEITIHEIAWMGTTHSANDEWMELKNNTSEDINLDGWLLKTTDKKIVIYLTGHIKANGFYLLERTDDDTVPGIAADILYKGSLGNSGQSLELYRNSNILTDSAGFSAEWPAGDNRTKQTMERTTDLTWRTSKNAGGTPKSENLAVVTSPKATPETAPEPAINYPTGVVINEILPSPDGPDETNEYIELYNNSTNQINLAGWKLQDGQGTQTTHTFGQTTMAANEYLVLKRPDTNILLNNDQDIIQLLFPNGKVVDIVNYAKAPTKQSYNKTASGWQWSGIATPGKKNVIGALATKIKTKALPKTKKPDNEITTAAQSFNDTNTANSEIFSASLEGGAQNPWLLFIIAAAISIISGIIFVILKLTLFKNHVGS